MCPNDQEPDNCEVFPDRAKEVMAVEVEEGSPFCMKAMLLFFYFDIVNLIQ